MAIYIWGSTIHDGLGSADSSDEQIPEPRKVEWSPSSSIELVASNSTHTLVLADDGRLYSCGNNDDHQLGRADDHTHPRKRTLLVDGLRNHVVVQMACGQTHSIAINEWGNLFTWGSNSFHQLGNTCPTDTQQPEPKLVKPLGTIHVVQVACGDHHNIVLTNDGVLYTFGLNNNGQCGQGEMNKVSKPTPLSSLAGIPIAFIACGSSHSFVLTKFGAVFGFGGNNGGQLGVGDTADRYVPTELITMRSIGVRHIAAGAVHSVFLTVDGRVFTCGNGDFTGLNTHDVVLLPRMVMELGSICTQIACGDHHTLTYVPSRERLYAFGINSCGQLGQKRIEHAMVPQLVSHTWASTDSMDSAAAPADQQDTVKRIFAGGDRSFATTHQQGTTGDYRVYSTWSQIEHITAEFIDQLASAGVDQTVDMNLMTTVETIFQSLACINASFISEEGRITQCSKYCSNVHMPAVIHAFTVIADMENTCLRNCIWDSIANHLMKKLARPPPDEEALRIYLILPAYDRFEDPRDYKQLQSLFGRAVLGLEKKYADTLITWWSNTSIAFFGRLVGVYKRIVHRILRSMQVHTLSGAVDDYPSVRYDNNLCVALKMLKLLFVINAKYRTERVPYEAFYMTDLKALIDLQRDYFNWISNRPSPPNDRHIYICDYPFLFDVNAKTVILQIDQTIQMYQAILQANIYDQQMFAHLSETGQSDYVVFNVTRENIVDDTISELLQAGASALKKPLKVKFMGEEAEDAGGVRKEFFLLLMKQLLDQKYGMFTEHEDSRLMWLAPHSFESEKMYGLIGTVCGLAIYNFVIINLPFPLALYKKLLSEPVALSDLEELSPTVYSSLQQILDYADDDLEDTFGLTFEVTSNVYGDIRSTELKPGGANIHVRQSNKKEYVDLYVDYVFNKSVEAQFSGFQQGFMKVCGGPIMHLFRSDELMSVIVGNVNYDWAVFEANARYKYGYDSKDETIVLFWKVFHELSLQEKKKFLLFLTGSDRVPVGGMEAIVITIQPVSDDRLLPVAHTCFNLLDLPRYQTREKLKYKLLQAIAHYQGFSLV